MWEERFAKPGYLFGTEPVGFLLRREAYFPAGARVLSIAEGEGRNAVHLSKRGLDVTGVEFAPSAVRKAEALAEQEGVSPVFLQSDLFEWDWPVDAFDITLGIFFQFVGPEGRDILFGKMLDATKPGGRVILHGYTPEQIELGTGGPPYVENMYTCEILREAFSGCDIELCETYLSEQRSGSAHVGQSALIDSVARKPA